MCAEKESQRIKIYQLSGGDELHHYKKSLVVCLKGSRKVLSTGPNNGGYRTDLQAVFNNDSNPGPGMSCTLRAGTYSEHMDLLALEDLGLDPKRCTGLSTAASMENVAIETLEYEDFSVTAIVTGGIRNNGGRIGDPAVWHEKSEISYQVKPGTINIILYIDANLSEGALARALVSCTEAKTAAIQELLAPSRYSRGLATGSGTDGTIVISNAESKTYLTNAGKHCKLGEYIGRTVKKAVKEALNRQSGLNPVWQHNILNRMDRFGVTEDTLWAAYKKAQKKPGAEETPFLRAEFADRLDRLKTEERLVTYTSLYAHLLDQLDWGLLKPQEAWAAGKQLLQLAGLTEEMSQETEEGPDLRNLQGAEEEKERWILWMTDRYLEGILRVILDRR